MVVDPILVKAIESSWSTETGGLFYEDNPSKGQCAVTSLIVQDFYGGQICRGVVGKISHYWNELPDGTQVDLTRQQFGERASELKFTGYRDREELFDPRYDTEDRYLILRELVLDKL